MEFSDLLPEIQQKIFSYLDVKELCKSVVLVCKQWYSFAYDPHLWKSVKFTKFDDKTSMSMNDVLDRCSVLRELTVVSVPDWQFILHLRNCPQLRKLQLTSCYDLTAKDASQLVRNCPDVEEFRMEKCGNIDICVIRELVQWRKLRKICLNFHPRAQSFDDDCVNLIANNCTKVEMLVISNFNRVSDDSIKSLIDRHGTTLKTLHLCKAGFTSDGFKSLQKCRNLLELKILSCDMTNEDLVTLKQLKSLRYLGTPLAEDFTSTGFSTLFQNNPLNCLVKLNFRGCYYIDDVVINSLVHCCSSLKSLNLSHCGQVTEFGMEAIASNCRCLEKLHLRMVRNVTCESFINLPQVLSTLKYLDVLYCKHVSAPTISAISAINRNIVIITNDFYNK